LNRNKGYLSLSPKRGEGGRKVLAGLNLYFLGVVGEGGMEEIQTLFHLRITGENGKKHASLLLLLRRQ